MRKGYNTNYKFSPTGRIRGHQTKKGVVILLCSLVATFLFFINKIDQGYFYK
jgi:hypothetical protein